MKTFLNALGHIGAPALVAFLSVAPLIAYAQTPTTGTCRITGQDISGFFTFAICVIDVLIVPLVFAIAFIVFIIGVYRYFIAGAANEEKRQEGQKFVLWGLIGFVLMFCVWGLINLLVTSFGFGSATRPPLPIFNTANRGGTNAAQVESSILPQNQGTTPNNGTTVEQGGGWNVIPYD